MEFILSRRYMHIHIYGCIYLSDVPEECRRYDNNPCKCKEAGKQAALCEYNTATNHCVGSWKGKLYIFSFEVL